MIAVWIKESKRMYKSHWLVLSRWFEFWMYQTKWLACIWAISHEATWFWRNRGRHWELKRQCKAFSQNDIASLKLFFSILQIHYNYLVLACLMLRAHEFEKRCKNKRRFGWWWISSCLNYWCLVWQEAFCWCCTNDKLKVKEGAISNYWKSKIQE